MLEAMPRTSLLGLLALAACAPPGTLAEMKDSGVFVQVPVNPAAFSDPDEAAIVVELPYEDARVVQRADCVTLLDDVRAEAAGLALSFDERGGWREADGLFGCDESGCGVCAPPRMQRAATDFDVDSDVDSPQTVLIEDETRSISMEIDGLFAERTMARTSPATSRVGGNVALLYSRPSEALSTLLATFVGTGQGGACNASFVVAVPRESDGTGAYGFELPAATSIDAATACAGPWVGSLRVSFEPAFEVLTCEGVERCSVAGNATIDVDLPLTVVP